MNGPPVFTLTQKDLENLDMPTALGLIKYQMEKELEKLNTPGISLEQYYAGYMKIKERYLMMLGGLFGKEDAEKYFRELFFMPYQKKPTTPENSPEISSQELM